MSSGSRGANDRNEGLSEESSLNTFQSMPNDLRLILDDFRANWQKELNEEQNKVDNTGPIQSEQQTPYSGETDHTKEVITPVINDEQSQLQKLANDLYHKAVELEQRGKVYDAIPFYRKAVQIEPDIEFKYYEQLQLKTNIQSPNKVLLGAKPTTKVENETDSVEDVPKDLYAKFESDLLHGKLIQSSRDPCIISTGMHISELPPELLIYILRWVVSDQLDVRSLENCAAVCKGMYILARDDELWKSVCVRVWGDNANILTYSTAEEDKNTADANCIVSQRYTTWRQMFIERERVSFNGCYISKTTYLRMGDSSYQDQYYRPVQLVEYYRYIRFLPDGTVVMATSSDEPAQGVAKLKNLHQLRPDVLKGHYRLYGSTVSIVVSKQQTKFITDTPTGGRGIKRTNTVSDEGSCNNTKYYIEFRVFNTSKRKFAQLVWLNYSIVQTRNKHETTSEFELTPSKYPPLWFSPVRSYHLYSDAPLI